LVVQEKLDYPVSETGLSGFHGFKTLDRPYTFISFPLFSLSHSRTSVRVTPRPPLVIPWFLCGILEFLDEINSPRNGVSVPQPVFPHLRYFHLFLDPFAPWMDLKFLWCIVFIHVMDPSPAISLCFIGRQTLVYEF
jgi:hypothetical protein